MNNFIEIYDIQNGEYYQLNVDRIERVGSENRGEEGICAVIYLMDSETFYPIKMTPTDFWAAMRNLDLAEVSRVGPGSPEDEEASQKEDEKSNIGKPIPPPDKVAQESGFKNKLL